ncbi:hypothetical protein OIU85_002615 [Salix viminalis]|uniref:Uncharacterized protein n=1 Tax=Salix viminalis TaxID=40686 RepID=A0A9Q0VNS2_SALVM|nr:hypothetical protein OIU85_002615 [Salix viminalis]
MMILFHFYSAIIELLHHDHLFRWPVLPWSQLPEWASTAFHSLGYVEYPRREAQSVVFPELLGMHASPVQWAERLGRVPFIGLSLRQSSPLVALQTVQRPSFSGLWTMGLG